MKGLSKLLEFAAGKLYLLGTATFIALFIFILSSHVEARTDVRDSMVKIYSVKNQPDYDNPWNMESPESVSGSGCVINGNRILTNAHVVILGQIADSCFIFQ